MCCCFCTCKLTIIDTPELIAHRYHLQHRLSVVVVCGQRFLWYRCSIEAAQHHHNHHPHFTHYHHTILFIPPSICGFLPPPHPAAGDVLLSPPLEAAASWVKRSGQSFRWSLLSLIMMTMIFFDGSNNVIIYIQYCEDHAPTKYRL